MPNGVIVIEGLDGSGKTTLRKALYRLFVEVRGVPPLSLTTTNYLDPTVADRLVQGKYHPVPGAEPDYLEAVVIDKMATESTLIRPSAGHRTVIIDRWLLSDMIFLAVRHGLPLRESYDRFAARLEVRASLTVLLAVPTHGAMARARERGDHTVRRDWDVEPVQQSAADIYASLVNQPGRYPLLGEVVVLDATRSRSELLYDAYRLLGDRDLI